MEGSAVVLTPAGMESLVSTDPALSLFLQIALILSDTELTSGDAGVVVDLKLTVAGKDVDAFEILRCLSTDADRLASVMAAAGVSAPPAGPTLCDDRPRIVDEEGELQGELMVMPERVHRRLIRTLDALSPESCPMAADALYDFVVRVARRLAVELLQQRLQNLRGTLAQMLTCLDLGTMEQVSALCQEATEGESATTLGTSVGLGFEDFSEELSKELGERLGDLVTDRTEDYQQTLRMVRQLAQSWRVDQFLRIEPASTSPAAEETPAPDGGLTRRFLYRRPQ